MRLLPRTPNLRPVATTPDLPPWTPTSRGYRPGLLTRGQPCQHLPRRHGRPRHAAAVQHAQPETGCDDPSLAAVCHIGSTTGMRLRWDSVHHGVCQCFRWPQSRAFAAPPRSRPWQPGRCPSSQSKLVRACIQACSRLHRGIRLSSWLQDRSVILWVASSTSGPLRVVSYGAVAGGAAEVLGAPAGL